eukprot:5010221-Pyramimonas_sp.AAC.1
MSKVVLSEQQQLLLDADRVTMMRVYDAAAAKRAAVVKEDDLLAQADIQAKPKKISQALFSPSSTRHGSTMNASKCRRSPNRRTS